MPGVKAGYWIPELAGDRGFDGTINGGLFNHLYAGFARVNRDGFADGTERSVIVFPTGNVGRKFEAFPNAVHDQNSNSKALLSIGGEGRSDDIAYVVIDRNRQKRFIKDSIKLARDFKYDGLDLCWLLPPATDDINDLMSTRLGGLLAKWQEALEKDAKEKSKPKLLLTAAVFGNRVSQNPHFRYPIQDLSDYLDWINVLAIDFYTPSKSPQKTGPVHAWRNPSNVGMNCGSASIDNWINGIGPNLVKIEAKKLVLGLPFYGYEWTLADKHQHDFFVDAIPHANPANEGSSLEFRKIQALHIRAKAGRRVNDDAYGASYWRHETSWIGYDDAYSIATKVGEAFREKSLGGYIAWHLAADDDQWTLSNAASKAWDDAISNPINP